MKYSIILLSLLIPFFLISKYDNLKKDDDQCINNCIYIESIDSIRSKEYIFYVIKAQNQKSELIKLMSYTKYNNTCNKDSKIKENNTYDLDVSTWFRTTYFNELDCFVIDSIEFCRDSTYSDIYGVQNLNGLCLGNW